MSFAVDKKMDGLGRVVLPKNLRDYYGITKSDRLMLIPTEDGILIKKFKTEKYNEESSDKQEV